MRRHPLSLCASHAQVMKTPELLDEQRAGIQGDNAAKLLKISFG
jgi:hypothetical protein